MDNSYYEENPNARPTNDGAGTPPTMPKGSSKGPKVPIIVAFVIIGVLLLAFPFVTAFLFNNKTSTMFEDAKSKIENDINNAQSKQDDTKVAEVKEPIRRLAKIYQAGGNEATITRKHCQDFEQSLGIENHVTICDEDEIFVRVTESKLNSSDIVSISVGNSKYCDYVVVSDGYKKLDTASQNQSNVCAAAKIKIVEDASLETKYDD